MVLQKLFLVFKKLRKVVSVGRKCTDFGSSVCFCMSSGSHDMGPVDFVTIYTGLYGLFISLCGKGMRTCSQKEKNNLGKCGHLPVEKTCVREASLAAQVAAKAG